MSALASVEKMNVPAGAPRSETTSMLQAIERLAMNPDLDLDRFERLIQMQERLQAREARRLYDEAMAEMQPEIPTIDERGQITGRNSFAKWDDINKVIKPILSRHGFSLTHRRADVADGQLSLTAILSHRAGHREDTTLSALPDKSGGKNEIQAIGSTLSYLQRYTAKLLINFTSAKGEDDDGNRGGGKVFITEDQVMQMRDLLESTGANVAQFLKAAKVERLEDILADKYEPLCVVIKQRGSARGRA